MAQSIATVTLVVGDYDAAITFYCDKLGFTLLADTDLGGGKRWVLVAPADSQGARLLLARADGPEQQLAIGQQTGGRVMLFLETDNFNRDFTAMTAKGVRFLELPRYEPYGSVAVFEDLYGNRWDLIEGLVPAMILLRAALALLLLHGPAVGQEEGWHYSPLGGEGDRATLGCALRSTPDLFTCIAVRCEDDFTIGIYAHTSRRQEHAGEWLVTIDRVNRPFVAELGEGPYGARLRDPDGWLLSNLQNGAVAYLHPLEGPPAPLNFIPLAGSLFEINRALAYCAPRVPDEPNGPPGVTPAHP